MKTAIIIAMSIAAITLVIISIIRIKQFIKTAKILCDLIDETHEQL